MASANARCKQGEKWLSRHFRKYLRGGDALCPMGKTSRAEARDAIPAGRSVGVSLAYFRSRSSLPSATLAGHRRFYLDV
jgi:hypothetical protein